MENIEKFALHIVVQLEKYKQFAVLSGITIANGANFSIKVQWE